MHNLISLSLTSQRETPQILPLTMSNSTKSFNRISIKNSASATLISTNDDLLTEILVRLPVRSLLRFKSVSKHWLSLITSQHIRDHPGRRKIISSSGLFLHRSSSLVNPEHDFVPLDLETQITKPPFKSLSFVNDPFGIKILQSCNGLLLCSTYRAPPVKQNYYVYNPTTNQFTILPRCTRPDFRHIAKVPSLLSVNLAFDPSKSPHYKAVSVYSSDTSPEHHEIEIYSSETGLWRPSGQPFLADVNFRNGTFWNGAIHWLGSWYGASSLYFDVNSEQVRVMPMPLTLFLDNEEVNGHIIVGESRDHLHLTQIIDRPTTKFNVYEMERDYSGWFLKYKVDLGGVLKAFPEIICTYFDPTDLNYYMYAVQSVVREENEEESFMVLLVPGKMIRYKFADQSFKKLCLVKADPIYDDEGYFQYRWFDSFQFIESLADV